MFSDHALLLMAIAVAVSSLALLANALASLGIYRSVRRLESRVEPLVPQAMETMRQAQGTLVEMNAQVKDISQKAHNVLDAAQVQLVALDDARGELQARLRVQAERLEIVLDDTLSRMQEVVGVFHSSVMRPVREVTGVVSGIRAAFQAFVRGRRPSVDRATLDDEMFI